VAEVHILNGATEFDEEFEQNVLRGTIDQECFRHLIIDRTYQREQGFSQTLIHNIADAYFQKKKITDITIGVRGNRFRQDGKDFWLIDKAYVIDGGQRLGAARVALAKKPTLRIQLGAKIFFNTTQDSEREMFCIMNATQQRVSASVLIRDRPDSAAAALLFALNGNEEFALSGQIGWNQKLQAGDALSGFQFTCVAGALHQHVGGASHGSTFHVLESLDRACAKVTGAVMTQNIVRFFDMLDECWTIHVPRKPRPDCLQMTFLLVMGKLVSLYPDFWDGEEFYFPAKYHKRLAKVDISNIRDQVRRMQRNNKDTKDVIFNILCQRLSLDPVRMRKPPPKEDRRSEARL
jgi:hypothetical protein